MFLWLFENDNNFKRELKVINVVVIVVGFIKIYKVLYLL